MTKRESTYACLSRDTLCASYTSRWPEEGSVLFVDDVLGARYANGL
jgi:hypothetical protein